MWSPPWSNQEVVARYWRLHPLRKNEDGSAADPTDAELNIWLNDAVRMKQIRQRLSDISWWMGRLSQKIAVKANHEDKCTGRFWEGRYKSQALLDEASILACAMYVDLNPIRAAIAQTPETSDYTGAKDRLDDLNLPHRRWSLSKTVMLGNVQGKNEQLGTPAKPNVKTAHFNIHRL